MTKKSKLLKILAVLCGIAVCGLVIAGFAVPKEVRVYVDDSIDVQEKIYETTERTVGQFLNAHKINFDEDEDRMDLDLEEPIRDGMEIHITKAFDVSLTVGGETSEVKTLPYTVEELLRSESVQLKRYDLVEPAMDTPLKPGDEVVVKRVTKVNETETEKVDYKTIYQPDSSMTIGDTAVTQEGRSGKIQKTYTVTYTDGKETERDLIETETLKKKKDKIISYGTKIAFGKPAGLQYVKKYDKVRAVSYYFSGSPRGSYGLPCEFGTVAVDPKLIPLGSLLYIEGYGYAVANDVGSSIKGKTVDLYMEKYEQCLLWGARWTTVYVIEER